MLLPLVVAACAGGDGPLDSGPAAADTDPPAAVGFTIAGITRDVAAVVPGAAGLAVAIADPTPALEGGEVTVLGSTTTDDSGRYAVPGVETTSVAGLLIVVSGEGIMTSATLVPQADYGGLGPGDSLSGRPAYILSSLMQQGIDMSLTMAGYTGASVATVGLLVVAVRDADGLPVGDATVDCGSCDGNVYYMDSSGEDGAFSTEGSRNASTQANAYAYAMIPGARRTTYTVDDAGAHSFRSQDGGSFPGVAAFLAISP